MQVAQNEKTLWTKLRVKLNQDFIYDAQWEEAIMIFESRLKKKFFTPIQLIIDAKLLQGEGFAILTVQCALIEMFAAFKKGQIFKHSSPNKENYEYNRSKQMFLSLIEHDELFKDHFWILESGKWKNGPYDAGNFYSDVRCGLMHEARTKNNWVINSAPKGTNVKTATQFIAEVDGKYQIYRTVLHYRLLEYLKKYQEELRQTGYTGIMMRKNFARKLDNLFDFERDSKYTWWI